MTILHITVGDRAQLREDTLQFIQQSETEEETADDDRAVLQFGSYDDLVDRDVSDVHANLKHLEVLGILELEEGSPSGAIQPVVPFNKIEMHIDYPLLDDVDADSTPASGD